MIAHLTNVDAEILAELARARDRLARCEGAVDQASKGVEAARAAHRRAVEERDGERDLVARLEGELKDGAHRRPLIAAAEAGARNGTPAPAPPAVEPPRRGRRTPPDSAGAGDSSREAMACAVADPPGLGAFGDWRSTPMRDVLFDAGVLPAVRDPIVWTLSEESEIETIGDLCEWLISWEWGGLRLQPGERRELVRAVAHYREQSGWTAETTWPDGFPESWLADADDDQADAEPDPPPAPEPPKPGRRPEPRNPGETVRQARERRRRERHAAGRPVRASGAQAIAELDAARAVIAGELPEPPATGEGAPDGPWPETRPDGSPAGRAQEPAAVTRVAELAAVREAIEEIEGPAGDGSRTWICLRCRAGYGDDLTQCPRCTYGPRRRAIGVLVELGAVPPATVRSVADDVADADERLREACGWGGIAERLTHPLAGPPTDADILAELADCWLNVQVRHCAGYRVRGGKRPAFWVGDVQTALARPTLEGADLVEQVRRVLRLERPETPSAGRASGAARRKRARGKEAARG